MMNATRTCSCLLGLALSACIPHTGGPQDGHSPTGTSKAAVPHGEGNVGSDGQPAGPTLDLRYRFAAGQVLTYKSSEETTISMQMATPAGVPGGLPAMPEMGANVSFHVLTETDFQLLIGAVHADGSADFTMNVLGFQSYLMPGRTLMANHDGLAADALQVRGAISPKGKVTFSEEVYLVVTEQNEKYYVRGSATATSATAEASDGETTVTVFAQYDPKTGRVVGGAKARVASPRKTAATLRIRKSDHRVDVLPKRIMDLFVLPEGTVQVNRATTLQVPGAAISFMVASLEANIATLKMSFAADAGAAAAQVAGEDGETDGAHSPTPAMPKLSGAVDGRFSVESGVLEGLTGSFRKQITTGVTLDITSKFSLIHVPK